MYFDFSSILDAVGTGIAGLIGVAFTAIGTIAVKRIEKEQNDRKLRNAIDDAVKATEEKSSTIKSSGDNKYHKCVEYVRALLNYDGITPPDDIVLEAMIHAKLCDKRQEENLSPFKSKKPVNKSVPKEQSKDDNTVVKSPAKPRKKPKLQPTQIEDTKEEP